MEDMVLRTDFKGETVKVPTDSLKDWEIEQEQIKSMRASGMSIQEIFIEQELNKANSLKTSVLADRLVGYIKEIKATNTIQNHSQFFQDIKIIEPNTNRDEVIARKFLLNNLYKVEGLPKQSLTIDDCVITYITDPNVDSTADIADIDYIKKHHYMTETVFKQGTERIGNSAFDGCTSLASVILPEGLKTIGNASFNKCTSLTNIVIPKGIESIGWSAFDSCTSLTSVSLPDGLKTIDSNAFSGCTNLTNIVIPQTCIKIGNNAVKNSNFKFISKTKDGQTIVSKE